MNANTQALIARLASLLELKALQNPFWRRVVLIVAVLGFAIGIVLSVRAQPQVLDNLIWLPVFWLVMVAIPVNQSLNRESGGSRGSRHIQFRALDLDLPRAHNSRDAQELLYRVAARIYLEDGARLKMGLGIYRPHRGPRVHIDCGSRYGHRHWGGKRKRWIRELLAENR